MLGIVLVAKTIWAEVSGSDVEKMSRGLVMIDTATGNPFNHTLELGEKIPVLAPSGGRTGIPAEKCFWTKEGKAKSDPTYVLMYGDAGKPGPTFCPECGRLVVRQNPPPSADGNPPPTAEQFKARVSAAN